MSITPIPKNIGEITGPLVLGHFFNWGLLGVLFVQSYIYYLAFPHDDVISKTSVAIIFLLESVQTGLTTQDLARNFGTGWGNVEDLDKIGDLWLTVLVLSTIISLFAQAFYAWRIYHLGDRNIIIPTIICILAIASSTTAIYAGVWGNIVGLFSKYSPQSYLSSTSGIVFSIVCNSTIAASMIFHLVRKNTGLSDTNIIFTRILRIAVESGLFCAVFAVLQLVLFRVYRHNNFNLAPSLVLSKLYSNSLLMVLNSRVRFVGGRSNPEVVIQGESNGTSLVFARPDTLTSNDVDRLGLAHVRNSAAVGRVSLHFKPSTNASTEHIGAGSEDGAKPAYP